MDNQNYSIVIANFTPFLQDWKESEEWISIFFKRTKRPLLWHMFLLNYLHLFLFSSIFFQCKGFKDTFSIFTFQFFYQHLFIFWLYRRLFYFALSCAFLFVLLSLTYYFDFILLMWSTTFNKKLIKFFND